ncbi:MAG TPA: hypothetical protein PLJ27_10190 [Polyangiaceae bacterium]|jgi:hypothetical protein|nr:hypothetical protein [Polyangiaceae bacterium]HNZ25327.1 hypothetical protein [Polyangiaceae bacterium]HOD24939.1 hypothetical protein [Polyangiaceae bacterium]HOE50386.1 hypothetical protein [Polyangiaceae bacterium]HOH03172.1 hypothetical protein [Polyangiaceae bacterium]
MTRNLAVGLFALVGCLTLAGCCGGKVQDCNKLVTVINKNGESIKAATAKMNAAKEDTKAIEEVASTMETAANDIKVVEIKDEELKKMAVEYEEMLRTGAKAARDMVKAANENDLPGLTKAMGEISKVETTEANLVNKVNQYCAN